MVQRNKSQIKKEFEAFAAKVSQLELLRAQLHALNTKGFENEAHLIEAKLHDVSAINEVKRDLEILRKKVEQKEVSHIGEKRIHSVLFSTSRELKNEASSMKRRISELERVLDKKKKISVKKQLSSSEVEFVKDVPHLERELKRLREAFETHTKSSHMRVDSGVGTIVDSHFDEFLSSIKGELSQKLKEKKLSMDSQFKEDLRDREAAFARRYKELVEEFHERYKHKVHSELQREVKLHFQQELENRLDQERKLIVAALVKENMGRLSKERTHLVHTLETTYKQKEQRLKQLLLDRQLKIKSELANRKSMVESELTLLKKREEELQRRKKLIEKQSHAEHVASVRSVQQALREKRLISQRAAELLKKHTLHHTQRLQASQNAYMKEHTRLVEERAQLHKQIEAMKHKERAILKESALRMREEIENHTRDTDKAFARQVEEIKSRTHAELQSQIHAMKKENDARMARELQKKESLIRAQLERDYQSKLAAAVSKHENELKEKKNMLEKRMMEHISKAFS